VLVSFAVATSVSIDRRVQCEIPRSRRTAVARQLDPEHESVETRCKERNALVGRLVGLTRIVSVTATNPSASALALSPALRAHALGVERSGDERGCRVQHPPAANPSAACFLANSYPRSAATNDCRDRG